MVELVMSSRAQHWSVSLDGQDLSGEYVMLEAMNIRYIGGAMELAPAASATDGALDVIAVREDERASFAEYLRAIQLGAEPPRAFTRRATRIEVSGAEILVHIDDEPWPARDGEGDADRVALGDQAMTIEVLPGAIEVLL
jgi:diacylglycerol kinase family enzyme